MDEKSYWLGRWARGETRWHQTEAEPALAAWFTGRPRKRVFVPLCGKSLDLIWLLGEGHEVTGCELSSTACDAFFKENQLPYTTTQTEGFTVYRGSSICLLYTSDAADE